MPDTKNQCKKLPTRRKDWKRILQTNTNSPNLWSLKVGLLHVASERSSKTKVGKQEKGKFYPESKVLVKAGWRQVSTATWEWFLYTEDDNGKHTNTTCPHGKNIFLQDPPTAASLTLTVDFYCNI